MVEVRPGVWIHVNPSIKVEATLLYNQLHYDAEEINFIWTMLAPGMRVVDIGAFVGVMTLIAAKRVGPEGRVLAFEPGSPNLIRFVDNCELNRAGNVDIIACAVGDRRGVIEYRYNPTTPDQSTVASESDEQTLRPVLVPVSPLDELLDGLAAPPIDFMKIDVEGAEVFVLAGGHKTISGAHAPLLIIEMNPVALRWARSSAACLTDVLLAAGYKLFVLELSPSRAFANVLAVKPVHYNRFPTLERYQLPELLTHEWYTSCALASQ